MADRQPPTGHQEPDHIADEPQGTVGQVGATGEIAAADRLLAEGPEGEIRDSKAGTSPGKTHDRDRCQHPRQPPAQTHHESPQHEPEHVQQEAEHGEREDP